MQQKPLKILEAIDSFYPAIDGPTVVVNNYAKELNKFAKCEIVVPKFPKYTDNFPYVVHRIKSVKFPEGVRYALPKLDKKSKKVVAKDNVDIIHAHSPFSLGKYYIKIGKKLKIPTVITFHTKFDEEIERYCKSKFIRKIVLKNIMKAFNKADYVLTVSNASIDTIRGYGYKGKIDVIRNGTDLVLPNDCESLVKRVNDAYNLHNQNNVFLFVGRIVSTKNIALVLNALAIVKSKTKDFKMLIVGGGPEVDNLKSLTKTLGLTENIIFTGKVMDRAFLAGHFLRSDLFLFPSTFDTASLVPIEAAAMKLPTLLIKGCSTAEIITDNVNGFAAEENPEAWAKRILEIIEDKKLLSQVKEDCYLTVNRTWEDVSKEIYVKYQECVEDYKNKNHK